MNDFKPLSESDSATRDALDQLEELHASLSAVADLTSPSSDMNCVDRSNLAVLLDLLLRLQGEANARAWEGFHKMRDREAEGAKLAGLADLVKDAKRKARAGDS